MESKFIIVLPMLYPQRCAYVKFVVILALGCLHRNQWTVSVG